MCGILGTSSTRRLDRGLFEKGLDTLKNRGPDYSAVLEFDSGQVLLGHARLSIIDPGPDGNQPIHNEDQSLWLVFNGEIYNYIELRSELLEAGHRFSTQSDSEVILHAYEQWGERCLDRFRGIFAFAIYSRIDGSFFLARDHFGTKPLYFSQIGGTFVFASLPSAINTTLGRTPDIDEHALEAFLYFGNVPGEACIYSGIGKLPPGSFLHFKKRRARIERYAWKATGENDDRGTTDSDERVKELIFEAVELNMRSDVPVAYLLSGGLDSSIVCSIASKLSSSKLNTFSVGFDVPESDETPYAMQAAALLGTQHRVAKLDFPRAMEQLPSVIQSFDEPFNINGLIPYAFLCETVRECGFKVAVGGDGADEIFGGYLWQESWWNRTRKVGQTTGFWHSLESRLRRSLHGPRSSIQNSYVEHFLESSGGLSRSLRKKVGLQSSVEQYVNTALDRASSRCPEDSILYPLFVDQECFLPDHCLVKVDRSSMRFGLEVRVPFLDQGLGQVIRNLEAEVLLGKSERKFLLRNLFASELTALDTKRKKGFSSPVNRWWQLGLQQLATDVFADSGLVRNNDLVRRCITGGQERNDAWSLFNLLSLCLWEDYWMGSRQFCDPQRLASYAKLS